MTSLIGKLYHLCEWTLKERGHCEISCAYINLWVFLKKKKKSGIWILGSENQLECSNRLHIVHTFSTRQFYRLREFQRDRTTPPYKKVDFSIWGRLFPCSFLTKNPPNPDEFFVGFSKEFVGQIFKFQIALTFFLLNRFQ